MNKNDQEFIVQKIRTEYSVKQDTKLDALKALDWKVKSPAVKLAVTVGIVASLVMGAGMSLVMTDIGSMIGVEEPMLPGVIIGIVGLLLAIINYPVYKKLLASRRKKYAPKIIELSESILKD